MDAPPGMTVQSDGGLQWPVGKGFADSTAHVTVLVRNDAGVETRHAFDLAITGEQVGGAQLIVNTKAKLTFEAPFHDAVMTPDNKTLIVSIPSKTSLVYIDTLANRELKKVKLKFQPDKLAIQRDWLFVSSEGSPTIRILNLNTGEEIKTIKVPGEPIQSMDVHAAKNWLYVSDLTNRIFSINPHQGTATKTKGWGQHVRVDADKIGRASCRERV